MENKVIRAALLGMGTVGTGVYKVLKRQQNEMEQKLGCSVKIDRILVRNTEKARAKTGEDPVEITDRFEDIITDPGLGIIIEVMGGIEPARTYITEALRKGISVVTANKDLMAEYGGELLDIATDNGADLFFEASVAGGIPIIQPLKQSLSANHLTEVVGIVNGTTNFILTRMFKDGMEFDDALSMAKDLGYAEADPTADVEGLDAARKMAILASIAFNSRVVFRDVHPEGITKISAKDIEYALEMGYAIKLLGVARNEEDGIEAYVCPMLISDKHPLAAVNDSFNAVFIHGDAVDDAMFFGRGAGELPTASAVAGDVFEVAINIRTGATGRIGCTCYKQIPVKKFEDTRNRFFSRMVVEDRSGVLAEMMEVLAGYKISIVQLIQKESRIKNMAEVVIMTDSVREGDFRDAMKELAKRTCVKEICSIIRVYGKTIG